MRALTPHVGAFAAARRRIRGSASASRRRSATGPPAGEFVAAEPGEALLLGCRDGALRVGTVQPPGKRWMAAGDYLRGHGLAGRRSAGPGR